MLSEKKRSRSILTAVVAIIVSSVSPALPAQAEHAGEAAERAATEILDARDRANDAAQAMFDAESRLDTLTTDLAAAEQDLAALEVEVAELRSGLTQSAVRQYVGAGQDSLMLFQDVGRTTETAAALVYTGAVTGSQLVHADDYEEAIDELDHARQALEQQRTDTIEARETWAALTIEAESRVIELQSIEQERLADAEVQHELERQRRRRAEEERQQREQEAQRQAAEAQSKAKAAPASASSSNGLASAGGSSGASQTAATPSPPPAAAVSASGSGAAPAAAPVTPPPAPTPAAASNAGSGMVCPVAGPRSFADTWGAPRSGGRSHEGVDMMAPGGTTLVAVESGSATFKANALGGNAVWITGSSGTKYYYAHLSAWEGSSRSVSQGDVIGYVGSTGNTSVNHLHFEVHPGGGRAVNPYPYVRSVC
ncbi:MAG: peptidoglycan DD-metalloendopeptidase family protein [Ilumatobacteraceae bacterium]